MFTSMKDKNCQEIILNIDEENQMCIDCKNNTITHVSINNGVTLCQSCSAKHSKLGNSISYIRSFNDQWDEYLFNFLIFGGNTKFAHFLKTYSIEESTEIELKYQTNACDYYRKTLKAKVLGNPLDEAIDPIIGKEMCISKEASSEFDNYVVKTGKEKANNPLMKVGGFFGQFGKKTWGEMKKAGQFVAEKTAPATDKIKQAGVFVAKKTAPATEKLKQAGHFVAEKTAPATNQIKKGANFVSTQVKNVYTDVKDKIIGKKDNEEAALEVNIKNINNNDEQEQVHQIDLPHENKEIDEQKEEGVVQEKKDDDNNEQVQEKEQDNTKEKETPTQNQAIS